jgi:hypothetical protein
MAEPSMIVPYFQHVSDNPCIRFQDLDRATNQPVYLIIFERCTACDNKNDFKHMPRERSMYNSINVTRYVVEQLLCYRCGSALKVCEEDVRYRSHHEGLKFNRIVKEQFDSLAKPPVNASLPTARY